MQGLHETRSNGVAANHLLVGAQNIMSILYFVLCFAKDVLCAISLRTMFFYCLHAINLHAPIINFITSVIAYCSKYNYGVQGVFMRLHHSWWYCVCRRVCGSVPDHVCPYGRCGICHGPRAEGRGRFFVLFLLVKILKTCSNLTRFTYDSRNRVSSAVDYGYTFAGTPHTSRPTKE